MFASAGPKSKLRLNRAPRNFIHANSNIQTFPRSFSFVCSPSTRSQFDICAPFMWQRKKKDIKAFTVVSFTSLHWQKSGSLKVKQGKCINWKISCERLNNIVRGDYQFNRGWRYVSAWVRVMCEKDAGRQMWRRGGRELGVSRAVEVPSACGTALQSEFNLFRISFQYPSCKTLRGDSQLHTVSQPGFSRSHKQGGVLCRLTNNNIRTHSHQAVLYSILCCSCSLL